jgi:hypothetical protein
MLDGSGGKPVELTASHLLGQGSQRTREPYASARALIAFTSAASGSAL